MIHMLPWKRRARRRRDEAEKLARLKRAEDELADLKTRAVKAVTILESRRDRNHWQESITRMIQGVN